jgi:hypothetical protein
MIGERPHPAARRGRVVVLRFRVPGQPEDRGQRDNKTERGQPAAARLDPVAEE